MRLLQMKKKKVMIKIVINNESKKDSIDKFKNDINNDIIQFVKN